MASPPTETSVWGLSNDARPRSTIFKTKVDHTHVRNSQSALPFCTAYAAAFAMQTNPLTSSLVFADEAHWRQPNPLHHSRDYSTVYSKVEWNVCMRICCNASQSRGSRPLKLALVLKERN